MQLSPFRLAAWSLATLLCWTPSVTGEVLERLSTVPDGWRYDGTPDGAQPVRLRIALKQHDDAGFEQAFLDMSTPGHDNYGKHFGSYEEMKRMLLPSDDAVTAIRDWLTSAGVTNIQQDADWVNIQTTVDEANALLDADFVWYASNEEDARLLRTLEYSVPDDIAEHVNMIQPTTRFGQMRPNRATLRFKPGRVDEKAIISSIRAGDLRHCDQATTPDCLKDLYNIPKLYRAGDSGSNRIGFASFLEEYARYADLAAFELKYAPYAIGQNFSVVEFNGGLNDQNSASDSGEANLDLQYIIGVSAPVPVTEYSTGGRGKMIPDLSQPDPNDNTNEPYLDFLHGILKLKQDELPQVLSTSYGEDEQTIPETYARTVCDLYKQLGSRGVSVIFSSGDSGVGAACETNEADPSERRTHFPPQFPASCPWVTSVGATSQSHPEEAVYFSSGGFSDYWERPPYQDEAVEAYLDKLGNRWSKYFNRNGRAFPDVAAQGTNFTVVDKGRVNLYDGTSCSAPVFSAVIALLNDVRFTEGKKTPLGFLNPWLYSLENGDGLNDIVDGGSTGCDGNNRFGGTPNGSPVIPYASWNATEGWDPVSGLGTPNFERLSKLALKA